MTVWGIRNDLARMRVNTRMSLSSMGVRTGASLGFWGRTWYWGDMIADTCLHAHVKVERPEDRDEVAAAMLKASAAVLDAFRRAASETPDVVPCQGVGLDHDGRIILLRNERETGIALAHARANGGYDRSAFPPADDTLMPSAEGGDAYDACVLSVMAGQRAGRMVYEWEDSLDPFAEPRYVRDTRPCVWQYRTMMRVRRFDENGVSAVGQQHMSATVASPDGHVAAQTAAQAVVTAERSFVAASPDFPAGYARQEPQRRHDADDIAGPE